ncbi:MAG: helix-turn-helix domain-containing protein [Clostridia bacterium]|nr:helix-turn-helix domain-containing protein [Clostridia bacterium]
MDIGKKIRSLRIQRGLTQEELGDRCELSKGFISQLERNLSSPSIATLTDLLECLGSSLQELFNEQPPEKTVFAPQDMFVKEDEEELRGSITWLVPDAQKNAMEPILVEMAEGGRSYSMPPNEGEEFGYVLGGSIFLVIGGRKIRVRSGCSFCIHPREEHYLMNAGKTKAKVLWVSTPPLF